MLERFGYAHDGFRMADFLDAPVRLVTAAGSTPSNALLSRIREQAGSEAAYSLEHEGDGFWVYKIRAADATQ